MSIVQWKDSYAIGVKKFDDHHIHLVEIINRLDEALRSSDQQAMVGDILRELSSYTVEHFRSEEEYMKSIHFDGFQHHHQEHEKLTRKLHDHMDALDLLGETIERGHLTFLSEWLLKHIVDEDAKYAEFAKARGLPAEG